MGVDVSFALILVAIVILQSQESYPYLNENFLFCINKAFLRLAPPNSTSSIFEKFGCEPRMSFRPLFIASLGNPPSVYKNTYHSAGHTLVSALHRHLTFPPFTKSRLYANGLLSKAEDFTFWQSPSLMNVSGPAVATAWKAFVRELPQDLRSNAKLVVVHDQLELPFGRIKVKHGGSHKGHNGLKSCIQSLGGMSFSRIEVGIGRPESRENKDVAAYVMKKMGNAELQKIENAIDEVMDALVEMRDS